jgi:hypothetical protein
VKLLQAAVGPDVKYRVGLMVVTSSHALFFWRTSLIASSLTEEKLINDGIRFCSNGISNPHAGFTPSAVR